MNRRKFNLKRALRTPAPDAAELETLAQQLRYGGNPAHKRNPGDFGLTPPAAPREGKTLCDAAAIFTREQAVALLREGVRRGLVSAREINGWPQNVWAVSDNHVPLEAMLDNAESGTYHGYPLQHGDPLIEDVVLRWSGT